MNCGFRFNQGAPRQKMGQMPNRPPQNRPVPPRPPVQPNRQQPMYQPTVCGNNLPYPAQKKGLSSGAKIGIIVGAAVGGLLLLFIIGVVCVLLFSNDPDITDGLDIVTTDPYTETTTEESTTDKTAKTNAVEKALDGGTFLALGEYAEGMAYYELYFDDGEAELTDWGSDNKKYTADYSVTESAVKVSFNTAYSKLDFKFDDTGYSRYLRYSFSESYPDVSGSADYSGYLLPKSEYDTYDKNDIIYDMHNLTLVATYFQDVLNMSERESELTFYKEGDGYSSMKAAFFNYSREHEVYCIPINDKLMKCELCLLDNGVLQDVYIFYIEKTDSGYQASFFEQEGTEIEGWVSP